MSLAEIRLQEGESLENALRRFKRKVQTEVASAFENVLKSRWALPFLRPTGHMLNSRFFVPRAIAQPSGHHSRCIVRYRGAESKTIASRPEERLSFAHFSLDSFFSLT